MNNNCFQEVRLGKSGHGEEKSLADQLADAKVAASRAENEIQQTRTKTCHLEKELKDKKEQLLLKSNEAAVLLKELEARKDEVGKIRLALQDVGYEEGSMETLEKVCFAYCSCSSIIHSSLSVRIRILIFWGWLGPSGDDRGYAGA